MYLVFNSNKVSDISAIKNLNNLKSINFGSNEVSDISALKELTNLSYLVFNSNKVNDISALKNLINLKQLYFNRNEVSDIRALKGLTKLANLDFSSNRVMDISPLKNIVNLGCLNFNNNEVSDISTLKNLTNLSNLNFNSYPVEDVNVLKELQSLTYVNYMSVDRFINLYNKMDEILKSIIKPGMSEIEKEKAIHDYIVLNTEYDYDNYLNNTIPRDDYTAYGVLLNGTGVCAGYSEATKLLLNACGIYCIEVTGKANGGNHGWNIVKIDGKYYHVDTTWNDPVPDRKGYVRHSYFNISDEQMSKDHTWDRDKYPKCN